MVFVPDPQYIVYETAHWRVNHRVDTAYPGYLMAAPRDPRAGSLPDLGPDALSELGPLLAWISRVIETTLQPRHLYLGRFGHQSGHNLHFHIIPIYDWTIRLYHSDPRYRMLKQFYRDTDGDDSPDGADLTLFVWREFCEGKKPLPPEAPSVARTVETLREAFAAERRA